MDFEAILCYSFATKFNYNNNINNLHLYYISFYYYTCIKDKFNQ